MNMMNRTIVRVRTAEPTRVILRMPQPKKPQAQGARNAGAVVVWTLVVLATTLLSGPVMGMVTAGAMLLGLILGVGTGTVTVTETLVVTVTGTVMEISGTATVTEMETSAQT